MEQWKLPKAQRSDMLGRGWVAPPRWGWRRQWEEPTSGVLVPGLDTNLGFRSTQDLDRSSSLGCYLPKCKSECVGTSFLPYASDF